MTTLSGSRVLITGASSGIGEALAIELAARGAAVGLLARRGDRLEALTERLREGGAEAAWAVADVRDSTALSEACERIATSLGDIDVVVANAGFGRPEPPSRFAPGRAVALYDVNLTGMLHTIDWALPRFLERGRGHLVGIASVASYFGFKHHAAYCGSKAAMRVHLTSLRLSLRKRGIAVTTICPGFVESELTATNPFPMPFLWPTPRAARRIAGAIEKRRAEVIFPWQMALLVATVTRLPRPVRDALLARF